ncbi:hypothetical protein GBAR_LOCUS13977 [Geodia barretti]|uniref:RFX-type winged-helix domain-containing protein n=1 Tax=Geodia barretti TaxID=519541 RepID=A0AA35S8P1_GEOBA|nr:hypothetical protein GBAR_LOCUS13977 [Geodia barretti]
MITLDSLYFLTNHHREVAQRVAIVCGLVDVLVWLLSFRIETLPSSSLAQMKLFFIGDSASLAQYLADIQAKPKQVQSLTLPVSGGVVSVGTRGVVASPLATNQIRSVTATRTGSPLLTNQIVARSQGEFPRGRSENSGHYCWEQSLFHSGEQGSDPHQQQPGEEFAIEWLKQTYEAQPTHHLVLLVDLYAQYVLHCSSKGKKTFLNNTEFLSALKKVFPSSQTREVRTVAKKLIHFITGLRRISQPSKTTPPLATNHTPSTVSTATSPSSVSTATSSTPQTNHGCTATQVTSTCPPNSVTQLTTFAPVQFGRKSSSVSLQSSSVASFGSTPTPPPSLSVSPSPSAPSSNVSSRDSTPSMRISPDLETLTPSPQPQTKRSSDQNSLCNDVTPAKNDVMVSRSSSLNSHISPTEAHFTASSLPSSSSSSSNSAIPRLLPSPLLLSLPPPPHLRSSSTPSLPSPPHTVTSLPTRQQPIATPTSKRSDDRNSSLPLENPNNLTNEELGEEKIKIFQIDKWKNLKMIPHL